MPQPFTDPASGYDDAPLEEGEIDRVREIVETEDLETITGLCEGLSNSQNQHLRLYLDQYFNDIGTGSAMEMSGGQDGIKISENDDRADIRNRILRLLNLPSITDEFQLCGSGAIANSFVF